MAWETVTRGESRREFLPVQRVPTRVVVSTCSEMTAVHVRVRASPVDSCCEAVGSLVIATTGGGTA